jgi:two-component system nitrogen regulation response regulator NtrX
MNQILIVDDEKDMRRVLSNILKEDGYTVYEAGDSGQALNFLTRESPPDLFLLDLKMPGEMDGIE